MTALAWLILATLYALAVWVIVRVVVGGRE